MKHLKTTLFFGFAAAMAIVLTACSSNDDVVTTETESEQVKINKEINQKVDNYLSAYYLWNDEYNQLTRDYTKGYKSFLEDNLMSLKTNTLDRKPYTKSDGTVAYALYSYIEQYVDLSSSNAKAAKATAGATLSATKDAEKELEYSFGFSKLVLVQVETGLYYFCVRSIYPGSAAEKKGLQRGYYITKVGGKNITTFNYESCYYSLMDPQSATTLDVEVFGHDKTTDTYMDETVSLSSAATYCNPIIYNKVETIGTHRIGYLVYDAFDAGFDEELFDVFKSFKSQNITDLVLDLRNNSGGYTISANLIASCIAGVACKDKVFNALRYNDARMKMMHITRDNENFAYPYYDNLDRRIDDGVMGLSKVYVLTTGSTASASELVINSLRGIDFDVVLIGEHTEGKNVGMEVKEVEVRDTTYRIVPITFQSYNAKDESDYANGFMPNYTVSEDDPSGTGYFEGYLPFGDSEEPLYAKAIELITGTTSSAKTRQARRTKNPLGRKARVLATPEVLRLGRYGMLK